MKKSVLYLSLAALTAAISLPIFSGCSAEVGFVLKEDETGQYYSANVTGFTSALSGELEIPAEYNGLPVKEIEDSGFAGTSVTKVIIPATVEKIGVAAFSYNNSLREVAFAEDSPVTEVPWGCFGFCQGLKKVGLPQSVTVIDGLSFYECIGLQEINIPAAVTKINISAFEDCSSLTQVNLPEGLISIGAKAFYNCSSLQSIILPDSLTITQTVKTDSEGKEQTVTTPAVGAAAFHTCTSLNFAVVGSGITELESGVFGYCTALEEVYLPAALKKIKGVILEDGEYSVGHTFHHDSALKKVYFAGSEEEWAAVEIDNQLYKYQSEPFDNSYLIEAEKVFNASYNK